ncbi:hypothetical protein J4434_06300 [Candidatus Woesearchaeota archaeon]|nr:hypothetical protein [Candidatus Woesearchaeota archaeon]
MTLFLILSFFLITIIGVFGNENITPLLNESLINNESQTINNSQSANIFILNNTFYTNIEYTKLFRIDNLVYPKKVNITVYYNLSSNDYNIDYFYENSFTAEINKYKTSDTGYLMLEQEGNYTLCASTKISDYVSCEEITVLDSNNAECDISLNLKLDKKYYYSEETLELNFEVNETIFPYYITYNINDFFGNSIRKNKITGKTSNTKLKPDKLLDIYYITAFLYPSCNDTNLLNNNLSKEIIIINNSTLNNNTDKNNSSTNKGNTDSFIKIESIYDNNNIVFGDSLRLKLTILKLNTSKSSVQSYVIDNEGKKVSEITKFSIFGDDIFQEMSIYIKLKDECKSSGIYYVIVEGLSAEDKMPVQIICNKKNEDKLSEKKETKENANTTKKSSADKKTDKKKSATQLSLSKAAFNESLSSLYQTNTLNNLELITNVSYSPLNTQNTTSNITSQIMFQGTQAKIKASIKWFLIFMLGLNLVFLLRKSQ